MDAQNDVGESNNSWRQPVYTFPASEEYIKRQIKQHPHLYNINISDEDWDIHCKAIERVLRPILSNLRTIAQRDFVGLEISNSFIRFGSARDGLKVIDGLEFDCILAFSIRGMSFTSVVATEFGQEKLGFVKVCVKNPFRLRRELPWLEKYRIVEHAVNDEYFLNTKQIQEVVFKSIVDKARQVINDQLADGNSIYSLRRTGKPPTFDIHITINKEKGIIDLYEDFQNFIVQNESYQELPKSLDFDIVPALLLRTDGIPNPYTAKSYLQGSEMDCPVYAVMKWAHKSKDAAGVIDAEHLWRECTSSYEKVILDIGRRNDSQKYLMTACRILKTYVKNQPGHVQLHGVAASQCLKTICFYCILFLTIPSDKNRLQGVREALGYFLYCLKICIENHNLPHFFFGNPYLQEMFPNSSFCRHQLKQKNLYSPFKTETFWQAERALNIMLRELSGLYTEFENLDMDRIGRFKEHLGLEHKYRYPDIQNGRLNIITSLFVLIVLLSVVMVFLAAILQSFYQ